MKRILLSFVFSLTLLACGPAAQALSCTADSYPDDGYALNAAAELDLRTRFEALADKMDEAATAHPTAAELEALFAAGTPSVRSLTTESARTAISDVFTHLELAAGNTWAPADPPTGHGGRYGTHVFSERGVDLGETVEKVVFSGTALRASRAPDDGHRHRGRRGSHGGPLRREPLVPHGRQGDDQP